MLGMSLALVRLCRSMQCVARRRFCMRPNDDRQSKNAGVNQWDSSDPPKYVNNTHLSSRVGTLNPRWNEDFSDDALHKRFLAAMQLTGREFQEAVDYTANVRPSCYTASRQTTCSAHHQLLNDAMT